MQRTLFVVILGVTVMMSACANSHYKTTSADASTQAGEGVALAGTAVDRYMDDQENELKQVLLAEYAADLLDITRLESDALQITTTSDATFAVSSATLSPEAQETLKKIADVLKSYKTTAVHVVGHTDSAGSAQFNMQLSRERAATVARFLVKQGVDAKRVLTWGRGETEPIVSNASRDGRAANRRVDIVIKPIVKGDTVAAFAEPPNLGT